jgi:16S rRNA pseudouridine516 synthase
MTVQSRQRLDKVLAHLGYGSRKEIKQLIKAKQVSVNGILAYDGGQKIFPFTDEITVQGNTVIYKEYIYVLLNKPQGVLSATKDTNTPTVIDLLPAEFQHFKPFPVGRLDKDTEGLLLLTNDGQLAHQLLAPRNHVPKTYYAKVEGLVTTKDITSFEEGVILDDGYQTLPAKLSILQAGPSSEVELTIYEGKFHQVKRMFLVLGKTVTFLQRIAMGPLTLDPSLKPGMYRELSETEVKMLQEYPSKGK